MAHGDLDFFTFLGFFLLQSLGPLVHMEQSQISNIPFDPVPSVDDGINLNLSFIM